MTGPSGTGKTELAKYVVRELVENKYKMGELTKDEYQKYSQDVLYLSGHPDATNTELWGKRVMDNTQYLTAQSSDAEVHNTGKKMISEVEKQSQDMQKFRYAMSALEQSMKTGIPIIIDEFLRYPESLLAYLKFFWSRKP